MYRSIINKYKMISGIQNDIIDSKECHRYKNILKIKKYLTHIFQAHYIPNKRKVSQEHKVSLKIQKYLIDTNVSYRQKCILNILN